MEKILNFNDVTSLYTNELTLIHAFLAGRILAYDKNTLEPINGKKIKCFFDNFGEIFKNGEVYSIKTKKPVYLDKKTGILYEQSLSDSEKNDSWIELYYRLEHLPEWKNNDPVDFWDAFEDGFPVFWEDVSVICKGIGVKEGKEITVHSVFKESEVFKVFVAENKKQQWGENIQKAIQGRLTQSPTPAPRLAQQDKGATATLESINLKEIFPSVSDRQLAGFEEFKKTLKRDFQTATRAAVAVIAYCHQQGQRLTRDDLQDLFDRPRDFPGAGALLEYAGKLSKALIQDVYTALPAEYRHERGQKKKDRQTSETS